MRNSLLASLLVVGLCCGAARARSDAPAAVEVEAADGGRVSVPDRAAKATALVFVSRDCPLSNRYAPEIRRIVDDYTPRGVAVLLVYVDADLTAAEALEHTREFGYGCRAVLDPTHRLVALAHADITPEAVVLGPNGSALYRGRIDDRYPRIGVRRERVTSHDLCDALDAVLRGDPVPSPTTDAVGCFIPAIP